MTWLDLFFSLAMIAIAITPLAYGYEPPKAGEAYIPEKIQD